MNRLRLAEWQWRVGPEWAGGRGGPLGSEGHLQGCLGRRYRVEPALSAPPRGDRDSQKDGLLRP